MPLTAAQKVEVKRHLGYHSAPQSRYPLVEGFYAVEDVLDALGLEACASVATILAKLLTFETQLGTVGTRLKASAIGSLKLNATETDQLWSEIARWRRELGVVIGIPNRRGSSSIVVV